MAKFIFYKGKRYKNNEELAIDFDICSVTLENRLSTGMALAKAISFGRIDRKAEKEAVKNLIEYNGEYYETFSSLCKAKNVKYTTFISRRQKGLSLEQCLQPNTRVIKKKTDLNMKEMLSEVLENQKLIFELLKSNSQPQAKSSKLSSQLNYTIDKFGNVTYQ